MSQGPRVCLHCGLGGGDGAGGVHTGLDASEMVVRGGRLSEPRLFSNLIVGSEGKRFLRLKKCHEGLCRFLTGKGAWTSPLASTTVFETLRARRDEKLDALAAVCFDRLEASASGGEDEEDPMARLGIDEAEAFEPVQAGPSRAIKRMRKGAALQRFDAIAVGLEPGYEFLVLSEKGSDAPAIELTASSLWHLFRAVNAESEVAERPPRGEKASRQGKAPGREPRGPAGKRQYWDGKKQRWVQKEKLPNSKYRVLTRRGTPCGDGDHALDGGDQAESSQQAEPSQPQ